MTNANMKLVLVNVELEDKLESPQQKLEAGEFIVPRVVELANLHEELKGAYENALPPDPSPTPFVRIRQEGWG